MIIPGLCSLTLRHFNPEEVIRITSEAGLKAIEWWARGHVLPGDLASAKYVSALMRNFGLLVSSYGTYYRVGGDNESQRSFTEILDTAVALGAFSVRVWAGDKNREITPAYDMARVIDDAHRIGDLAALAGLTITFEFHANTLTNSGPNARLLADAIPHPNIYFSWQPALATTCNRCMDDLKGLLDRLSTVHVFHWTAKSNHESVQGDVRHTVTFTRRPLEEGTRDWSAYLDQVRTTGRDHFALLEFVRNDSIEQLRLDSATLSRLCKPQIRN